MIDKEYLQQLRDNAAEVRADLEERAHMCTFADDPEAMHDEVMEATRVLRSTGSQLVHKTMEGKIGIPKFSNGDGDAPPFTDLQNEVLADAIAQIRMELQDTIASAIADAVAPLRDRIANLEGQISMLTALLGDSNRSKTFEASETVRKLAVR